MMYDSRVVPRSSSRNEEAEQVSSVEDSRNVWKLRVFVSVSKT